MPSMINGILLIFFLKDQGECTQISIQKIDISLQLLVDIVRIINWVTNEISRTIGRGCSFKET